MYVVVCMKRYGATRTCAPALAWGEADGVDCQRLCVVTGEWYPAITAGFLLVNADGGRRAMFEVQSPVPPQPLHVLYAWWVVWKVDVSHTTF